MERVGNGIYSVKEAYRVLHSGPVAHFLIGCCIQGQLLISLLKVFG